MNYIVFDLEWNQSPYGKEKEIEEMPFEVIDIGAVKLDGKKQVTGSFHEFVKPQVYKKLHYRTREKINISLDDIKNGRPFASVISDFFDWCGEDVMFCTWGAQDTLELQRNIDYFGAENRFPRPLFFMDIQRLYAIEYNGNRRCSLEKAVADLNISAKAGFHEAYDDALYTAEVFRFIDDDVAADNYSLDYYRNPRTPEEEIFIQYRERVKFVSREYDSRERAMSVKMIRNAPCPVCGGETETLVEWTARPAKKYLKLASCPEHGYIRGKVRFKPVSAERGKKYYAIKTLKIINGDRAAKMIKELKSGHACPK